ncbi:hypothetical protein BGZ70_000812, partial [Mortierella alpina]
AVLTVKGEVKAECATDEKMADFYDKKVDCFRDCRDSESPEKKAKCLQFVADPTAKPPQFKPQLMPKDALWKP